MGLLNHDEVCVPTDKMSDILASDANGVRTPCATKNCIGWIGPRLDGQPTIFKHCMTCSRKRKATEEATYDVKDESAFTPVPTCVEHGCVRRTRPFKNDPTRYTKRCDECSGALTMELYARKASKCTEYAGPVCREQACMSECALIKGSNTRYRKYCLPCGEAKAASYKAWKAAQQEEEHQDEVQV